MRRLRTLVLAALFAASVPFVSGHVGAQQAQALPAERALEVAGKVQAFYDRTTNFASDFEQEFFVKAHNVKKTSKGRVTFMKPGKMIWDYTEPQGNRVVSDGSVLKVYEAANHQMYEQAVDKSQYPAALAFLTGGGKLNEIFTFDLYEGQAMNFPNGLVLVGTPKQPTPAYTKVLFYVDSATFQVRRMLIVDGQGNRNRFDFATPKVNDKDLKEIVFKFEPPPGTTIVRQ